jgi:hypothetical protein
MPNTKKCLVITYGFFGDIMFASSLAKKLKADYDNIDYVIGFPQIKTLLQNNPYVNDVYVSIPYGPTAQVTTDFANQYDRVIQLRSLNYLVTPCEEYQQQAEIDNTSSEYEIHTIPEYDEIATNYVNQLKTEHGKPVVTIMANWQSKTYIFTPEQYDAGIDVPGLGYGGQHRNIPEIIDKLSKHFTLIPVGMPAASQYETISISDNNTKSLTFEASILKHCDAFIGTEGGLANLAAGVGCRTILTGDFIHQLYGPNGCIKKIKFPQLGPDKYFKTVGHLMMNPYYTDSEVIEQIIESLL